MTTAAIALMLTGTLVVLLSLVATIAWRREGVALAALIRAGAVSEGHVRPERVGALRRLRLGGVLLFLAGVVAVLVSGAMRWS